MRRLWPAADRAWRVGRSVGRLASPRAATPADTAPLVTTTTLCPAARNATTSWHSLTTAPRSITPRSSVSDEEPILATTVLTSAVAVVVEAEVADPHHVARAGAGLGQRLVHA